MPQRAWSRKRERQYEHIKEGAKKQGVAEKKAEEVAARTVNKERARAGEAKEASPTSVKDISSGRRGGIRSGTERPKGRTKDQLYNEARQRGIEGRSRMSKVQLPAGTGRKGQRDRPSEEEHTPQHLSPHLREDRRLWMPPS